MSSSGEMSPSASQSSEISHGEIFTRPWIVELILDLVGYDASSNLAHTTLVEPSCGSGAFLRCAVTRLSQSLKFQGLTLDDAVNSIRAWDLLEDNVLLSRAMVSSILIEDGWGEDASETAARAWITCGDFLLVDHESLQADFVVGNPPYIRMEDIDPDKLMVYRSNLKTMAGRADLFVGFYEIGLKLLKPEGVLGFICADRWMKNQYGEKLRRMVASQFALDKAIMLHDVDAFEEGVSAYPAITTIRNGAQGKVLIAETTSDFKTQSASKFAKWAKSSRIEIFETAGISATYLPHWFDGEGSWPWGSPERLKLLEMLNDKFEPLQSLETGTRVGIGIATGKDDIYLVKDAPIETSRLLPLAMSKDTRSGELQWSGTYLVNPWESDGTLVNLDEYPKLKKYLNAHKSALLARNIAGRGSVDKPATWYRTIDKVDSALTKKHKLLFPDMKMTTHPVLESGETYPHHNLYYIVSDSWNMKVLGGLLLSKVAEFFVECYAVKMRGGTLRFQSQYLRRIRVPRPADISEEDAKVLIKAFDERDEASATRVALKIYGISEIPR
jgi:adenine-specific DNA-methyltransferase